MSRYATDEGGKAVVNNMLNTLAQKETQYIEGVKRNHAMAKMAADRLRQFKKELPQLAGGVLGQDELDEYFEKEQTVLLEVAEKNVVREREVKAFVHTLQSLRGHCDENTDFDAAIKQGMDEYLAKAKRVNVHEEQLYTEIAEKLGIPSKKKNEDEDIEIMMDETQNRSSLKCPLTGALMEDPVRNKVCGHSYSRAGIEQHMRISRQCPIPGCQNQTLSAGQLEEDHETVMQVRREKRRLDREAEMRASQADDLVDSDED